MTSKAEIIKRAFTVDQPLGPIQSSDAQSPESRTLFTSYFDEDNLPIRELRRNPSMIVGRRGSGKTDALLYCARDKRFTHKIYFNANNSAKMFMNIIKDVEKAIVENGTPPFVEAVSELWSALFWFTIISSLEYDFLANRPIPPDNSPERSMTADFCAPLGCPSLVTSHRMRSRFKQ